MRAAHIVVMIGLVVGGLAAIRPFSTYSTSGQMDSISFIHWNHSHPAEFVDGKLFVIRRFEGPDWTDELWKYSDGGGQRLFSARGINFRVSQDGRQIAVLYPIDRNGVIDALVFIDQDGSALRTFQRGDFSVVDDGVLDLAIWGGESFWVEERIGRSLSRLFSVDVITGEVTSYDVSALGVADHEYALQPETNTILFSSYVSPLDVDDLLNVPKQSVLLSLYRLTDGTMETVATTTTNQPLEPTWVDEDTFEYRGEDGIVRKDF